MSYADESAKITPAKAEILLRALDRIAEADVSARPGHVAYVSKSDMQHGAKLALAAVRTPIHAD